MKKSRFIAACILAACVLTSALLAQNSAQSKVKSVLGTVEGFKVEANISELEIKADDGESVSVTFGPDTQVLRVGPGEHDLTKAEPVSATDILTGDRVLVSFVDGMSEARRIVLITARDIAKRNEAEMLDWDKRGIFGRVTSRSGNEITLQSADGPVTVIVTDKTVVRCYAPDSVKFSDAKPSSISEIALADQLRARGDKSADGVKMTADEIVFGTFLTHVGNITSVNPDSNEITMQTVGNEQPLTVRITADSKLKTLPDMHPTTAGNQHDAGEEQQGPPPDGAQMMKMLGRFPAIAPQDLKVGDAVVVTSTKGTKNNEVTAIMLLAHADFVVAMMQYRATGRNASGMPNMDEMVKRHASVMNGPGGGLSLPAMIP